MSILLKSCNHLLRNYKKCSIGAGLPPIESGLVMFSQSNEVNPWEPQPQLFDRQYWLQIHESFVNESRLKGKDIKVVFIGASIVQNWQSEGRQVWNQFYRGKGFVNWGIGGDTVQNVLWRVNDRLFDGLDTKVVVIQCGTNNIEPSGRPSEEDIARGIDRLIQDLRQKVPNSRIIVVGILPLNDSVFQMKAKMINEFIAKSADDMNVFFLDLTPAMTDLCGKQKSDLFTDGLHLSGKGYNVWHDSMQPLLQKLLN